MTRSLWYILIIFLVGGSCSGEEKPVSILSKEEMIVFLLDVYLAEARIAATPVSRDSAMRLFYPREKALLEKHGLTDSTLQINYQYYLQKPEALEEILGAVIDSLNLREQKLFKEP